MSKKGWTQKELSERLEIKQYNLSRIETGTRAISKAMAKKLSDVFKVDYREFFVIVEQGAEMKKYNIFDLVTQRPPYLMLDEIIELHVGERCVATKYFSLNEPCLSTSNESIDVPESLMFEMIRRASVALINQDEQMKGLFLE